MNIRIPIALVLFGIICAASCEERRSADSRMPTQEELLDAHKRKVTKETDLIDEFVNRSGWEMKSSETGLRYMVYHHGKGDSAAQGRQATITYTSFLLDGTKIGGTEASGPLSFKIGQGDVVSGIHEAVDLLAEGDSARFIIPSYLAYGLTGDQNRIPPNAALFYDLALVAID